ncbi:hypothetical protein [Ferrimicrobium acidiphilum]|uniref:glycan biosynthesis hexose transferase WsfD n=1 Tax=Ferrimicrobium acidiphilum TaxID=121039 RepID=UPI0023EFE335|nr:hypothetical protein [Ferrimicrobium acidiphilum]
MRKSALIALGSTILMVIRLFLPNPIGMADNGDGARLMCQVGVAPLQTGRPNLYFNWAIFHYYASAYHPISCGHYPGIVVEIYKFNIWLSDLLGMHATLNLGIDMILYAAVVGILTGFLVQMFDFSTWAQIAVGAGFFLIAGDSVFAGYPGSPYAGVTGLVGLLLMSVALIYYLKDGPFAARAFGMIGFTIGAIALVATMVETVLFAVPLVIFLLWMVVRPKYHALARIESIGLRVLAALSAGTIGYAAYHTYQRDPKTFQIINPTEAILGNILVGASHPRGDLKSMGLPASFARYAGTSWWSPHAIEQLSSFARYESRISYVTMAKFYLTHPLAILRVANHGATRFFIARPTYMGSFARGVEPAGSLEHRLPFLGNLMSDFQSLGIFALLIVSISALVLAVHFLRRPIGTQTHAYAVLALLLNTMVMVGFATAVFGESIETTKHLVFTIMAAMLCGLSLVLMLVSYYKIDRKREPRTVLVSDKPRPATGLVEILP